MKKIPKGVISSCSKEHEKYNLKAYKSKVRKSGKKYAKEFLKRDVKSGDKYD